MRWEQRCHITREREQKAKEAEGCKDKDKGKGKEGLRVEFFLGRDLAAPFAGNLLAIVSPDTQEARCL